MQRSDGKCLHSKCMKFCVKHSLTLRGVVLDPSREIEKASSYREFELSRVKLYRK